MQLRGKTVLVVGLAQSGLSAVRLLCARGARVIANDRRDEAQLGRIAAQARTAGAKLELGGHDPHLFTSVDRIVVSPGVPSLPALEAAERAGVPIIGEVELAASLLHGTLVGITGTNGKSTVTSLIGNMCERTGRPTFVGGNLGEPLSDAVGSPADCDDGFCVVELSSFQLERARQLRCHVAVLLNVTEDHFDRYASFAEYAAAKGRIFHGQGREDVAVVPQDDALCRSLARAGAARIVEFGGRHGEARVDEATLLDAESGLRVPVAELGLQGAHNLSNACAAASAARCVGVPPESIAEVLREFRGLPHRMQHVADVDEVAFYDDSKATNVGAAVAALRGLASRGGSVVLIAGGKDKGGDYAPLCEALKKRGRAVVLIGEAADRLHEALNGSGLPLQHAAGMAEAVERAYALARPGDAVLLAPACASFDMFRSFGHRGDVFQQAVEALAGGARCA